MKACRFENNLVAYAERTLGRESVRRMEVHLAHCETCREEAALLQSILPLLGRELRHPAPRNGWRDVLHLIRSEVSPELPPAPRHPLFPVVRLIAFVSGLVLAAGMIVGYASASLDDDTALRDAVAERDTMIATGELPLWCRRPAGTHQEQAGSLHHKGR